MRLLVACPQCQRQYDASGRRVGSRFRCHCGSVVTVAQPKGHEADVVRCSSCGGPREGQSLACGHCGADFTIHERDLETICPHCLARVSDRAKFCHHCGTGLTPEELACAKTQYSCPACEGQRQLVSRRLAAYDVTALECDLCAGLWLGTEAFELVTQRSHDAAMQAMGPNKMAPPPTPQDAPTGRPTRYRSCVVCGKLMHRDNFGRRSGVVVDVCRPHGIWFDSDELSRIVTWIRKGGLAQALKDVEDETGRIERYRQHLYKPPPRMLDPEGGVWGDASDEPFTIWGNLRGRDGDSPLGQVIDLAMDLLYKWQHR